MLNPSQELKIRILAAGLTITNEARAWLSESTQNKGLSSADYASTSGIILRLSDDVWVNAPIEDYNPNFVHESLATLDHTSNGLTIRWGKVEIPAEYCLPPAYHSSKQMAAFPPYLLFTHADRARLSPMNGCSMGCRFCNIPFEKPAPKYELFSPQLCIDALKIAVNDPIQPAQHIMISGGTPKADDISHHKIMYQEILHAFPNIDIDIMMVPIPGLLDVAELKKAGVNEISVNLEVFNEKLGRQITPQKFKYGRELYLDFIEMATQELGAGKVRSMLLVGLEPLESTLEGVAAIAERGAIPVLSPFRPDPITPLKDTAPPSYELMRETYLRGQEIAINHGVLLGPSCPPCTHNTLSFAEDANGAIKYRHTPPKML